MTQHIQHLGEWRFKATDETNWLPARVPGSVHTDLRRSGLIPDPFDGTNERDLQWIDRKDWEYAATFDVPAELLGESKLELVFEGLDTYADVYLNGSRILSADNMFRTWTVDVKHAVRPTGNELRVRFRSAINEGLKKLEASAYGYPAPNDDSKIAGLGDKKVSVFTRKAPYHFGWDWGPRFVTCGIWKNVSLRAWSGFRITDLFIRQDDVSADRAILTAEVEIEAEIAGEATLRLRADGQAWETTVQLAEGLQTVRLPAEIASPKLWWSRGLGESHLYAFEAELSLDGRTAVRGVRTGLRRIRVVRENDEAGTTFYFEVNGVPVFAKGANHIPNDSFLNEITYERYRHEIASAAASNFNMLRVWGGGIYEFDDFYRLCDEYGILVWQDFMFACSMYPGDEAFLANVGAEAADNLRRLRNHPSIALWCGNNEIDGAWQQYVEEGGWGWKKLYTASQREQLWADYEAVFHRLLPEAVERFAPGAVYWPSSPIQALTGDASQHATNNSARGDIHYWAVWHAKEPFENYNDNIGRFMSEYGFQSFPEYRTVRSYARESEMALESDAMLLHQKNGQGNQLIRAYSEKYNKEPKDFISFLYVSQVLQAEAMKTAIEAHRRRKPFCMGSLYWQMNDCWPVASWASIDYFGRWKATQYYARKSCKDVLLSIAERDGELSLHIVNDLLSPVEGRLKVRLLDFAGELLRELTMPAAVGANAAAKVYAAPVSEWLTGAVREQVVLAAELVSTTGETVDASLHYFVHDRELALPASPEIVVSEVAGSGGSAYMLTASRLAKQVYLEAEQEGIFSDNFFDLLPGETKSVAFQRRSDGAEPFVPGATGRLTVRSMKDFVHA